MRDNTDFMLRAAGSLAALLLLLCLHYGAHAEAARAADSMVSAALQR